MHKNKQKGDGWDVIAFATKVLELSLVVAMALTILSSTQIYIGY